MTKDKWLYVVLVIMLIFLTYSFLSLQKVKPQLDIAQKELALKTQEIASLQQSNNTKIKEAVHSAYKQAISVPDSDMLDTVNALIDGARSRNAERERDNSNTQ